MDGWWIFDICGIEFKHGKWQVVGKDYMTFTSREGVENHIRDVCELKASVYLQQFIAWKGELLFDLVTTSVDVILDVFGNICACGIY